MEIHDSSHPHGLGNDSERGHGNPSNLGLSSTKIFIALSKIQNERVAHVAPGDLASEKMRKSVKEDRFSASILSLEHLA